MDSFSNLAVLALAAFGAGVLNAIAGGGTFLTFPALVWTGVPPIAANATSALAVCPGYLGSALGFRAELAALPRALRLREVALSALGGWGNGNKLQIDFSIPLFFADSSTPRQTITGPGSDYCYGGPDCDPVPFQMPLPTNGNAEGSSTYVCDTSNDCHVLVVERAG